MWAPLCPFEKWRVDQGKGATLREDKVGGNIIIIIMMIAYNSFLIGTRIEIN